ncbi:MAG: hypothetical protein JWQ83_1139 [Lacunisphaera sp.]|nr:hypothetical protein [Lacunisphaera sp.]
MANRRPADWRFPTDRQQRAEETARRMQAATDTKSGHKPDLAPSSYPPLPTPGPADPMPDSYWDAVLADPRASARPGVHISQRRLSEIPRPLLRVSCRKCDRTIEVTTGDAQRLYGQHAVWKDVGSTLLEANCTARTGSRDDDGCWPNFETP